MSSQESMTSVMSQLSSPSTPHEESVLETYFQLLSQADYDQAKDLVDNEKDGHKFSFAAFWGETLQCLSQLATAEKSYGHLVFLTQKSFRNIVRNSQKTLRNIVRSKDGPKSIYMLVFQEFERMNPSLMLQPQDSLFSIASDQILGVISGEICSFLKARIKMIEFYEQLSSLVGMRQWVVFEDLVMMCEDVLKSHMKGLTHPLLSPLKLLLSLECESLAHLLHAQILISNWQFLPASLQLHHAHVKLNTWLKMVPVKEVKSRLGRSTTRNVNLPGQYSWLHHLKGLLLSKFGLYFYNVLSKQSSLTDVKANLAKSPEDFVGRINTFQRRSDAAHVFLIVNSDELELQYRGQPLDGSYHHPKKYMQPSSDEEIFKIMFTSPLDRQINPTHLNAITSMVQSNSVPSSSSSSIGGSSGSLDGLGDKVRYSFNKSDEKKSQCSYFIIRTDPSIHLSVVFECKKNEKDSSTNSFMTEMATQLRSQAALGAIRNFVRS